MRLGYVSLITTPLVELTSGAISRGAFWVKLINFAVSKRVLVSP